MDWSVLFFPNTSIGVEHGKEDILLVVKEIQFERL